MSRLTESLTQSIEDSKNRCNEATARKQAALVQQDALFKGVILEAQLRTAIAAQSNA